MVHGKQQAILQLMQTLRAHLSAGGNTATALQAASEQESYPKLAKMFQKISKEVNQGAFLYQSMQKRADIFDPTVINLIEIGESNAQLPATIDYIIQLLKKRHQLKQQLLSAILYPGFVFFSLGILGTIVAFVVLPKLKPLFADLTIELPITTKILLGSADLVTEHTLITLLGLITILFGIIAFIVTPFFKKYRDRLALKVPIIGRIIRNSTLLKQFHDLNSLLSNSVNIHLALISLSQNTRHYDYHNILVKVSEKVGAGETLAKSLKPYDKHYPAWIRNLLDTGESNGMLPDAVATVTYDLEAKLDAQMRNLTIALEPILLIAVGLVMLFVAVAIISPIYSLTGGI